MGTTDPKAKPYRNAESPAEVAAWKKNHKVVTFEQAVQEQLKRNNASEAKLSKWKQENAAFPGIAHEDARALARELLGGPEPFWDWELPRTREGYFVLNAGIPTCIHRMRHFAPYCDIMWAETAKPILKDAQVCTFECGWVDQGLCVSAFQCEHAKPQAQLPHPYIWSGVFAGAGCRRGGRVWTG